MKHPEEKPWPVLRSEYLFQRPWLTVRRESLLLPNGNEIPEYYVLEYPEWVNVLAITRDGQFVFVRQYRRGLDCYLTELCAGVCDPEDASPMEAARRELLEETGYGNGNWQQYMTVSANPGTHNNLTHCFLATDVERISDPNAESTEDLQIELLSAAEVRGMLERDEIKQSLHAASLWKYMAEHPDCR